MGLFAVLIESRRPGELALEEIVEPAVDRL